VENHENPEYDHEIDELIEVSNGEEDSYDN
jgi:hypothetical protein